MLQKYALLTILISLLFLGNIEANTGNVEKTNIPIDYIMLRADVWADNWFAFYSSSTLVKEDSIPITTERSFNRESFTFRGSFPLVLNFIAKDFKQNDTGLEYIGKFSQQMGDAGLIAQFFDVSTGKLIAVTNTQWKCMVLHEAPLHKSCVNESLPIAGKFPCEFRKSNEPEGWKEKDYDDSSWPGAIFYTSTQVRPKGGYEEVTWDPTAKLIWTSDLETHNTILCRLKIEKP